LTLWELLSLQKMLSSRESGVIVGGAIVVAIVFFVAVAGVVFAIILVEVIVLAGVVVIVVIVVCGAHSSELRQLSHRGWWVTQLGGSASAVCPPSLLPLL